MFILFFPFLNSLIPVVGSYGFHISKSMRFVKFDDQKVTFTSFASCPRMKFPIPDTAIEIIIRF